ncbi:MAG: hypothetical protein NWE75_05100 [Candidatus Bathyarchaeota archaeon]|nr:hypothetical protein [Candidatus Bathyarchaeota archaeon]
MVVRVIEQGPFGCLIDRGTTDDPEDIPEGYKAKRMETSAETVTVYIEPSVKGNP